MVFYKDKIIPLLVASEISEELAVVTDAVLKAKIEVRILEPIYMFNANEIHIEVRFRDFNEWSNKQLEDYHGKTMKMIKKILQKHKIKCQYSFYILPSMPPRSIWTQEKS